MEKYIFLRSNDSKVNYFKDNNSYHFRVKLNQRLIFHGYWVVSLTEINFGKLIGVDNIKDPYVDILCNLCDTSLVGDVQLPLLRHIDLRLGPNYTFANEYNIHVVVKESPDIEIVIKVSDEVSQTFLSEDTTVTLHLQRYPFAS